MAEPDKDRNDREAGRQLAGVAICAGLILHVHDLHEAQSRQREA